MGQVTDKASSNITKPMNEVPQLLDELVVVISNLEDNYAELSRRLSPVKRNEPTQTPPDSDRSVSTEVGAALSSLVRRIRSVNALVLEDQDLLEL